MAVTFDFTGTSGTPLETYDSRFECVEPGAFIIASGYLIKASGRVWYEDRFVFKNGQGDVQEIEAVVAPRALSGEDVRINLHQDIDNPSAIVDGYRVEVYASVVRLSRQGSLFAQENHAESVTGVEHTVRIKHDGASVKVWLNGNLYIDATDSTPLTGGWPGAMIYSAGNQAGAGLNTLIDHSPLGGGGMDGDAPGANFSGSGALVAGSAQGAATASGLSMTADAALVAGSAQGAATASGLSMRADAAPVAGGAAGAAHAPGYTYPAVGRMTAGQPSGDASAPGRTFTAAARLITLTSESQDANAPGAVFASISVFHPGEARVERPSLPGGGAIFHAKKVRPQRRKKIARVDAKANGAVFTAVTTFRAGSADASAQARGNAFQFSMHMRRGTVRASAKAPALRAQISGLYLAPDGVEQRDHYMRLLTEDALLLGQIG